jgi:nucleoside-diphosphate-sugar epimerase
MQLGQLNPLLEYLRSRSRDPQLKIIGLRFSNIMEPHDYSRFPGFQDDAQKRKWNFWSYVDARDVAQAVRLSLESNTKGAEIFIIANADTVMERDNESILREGFSRCSP